ncbi:MAG: DUF4388 domain-containing protein [Myxococcota bacterium]|nr:DUF4388 domain-containing protein [Myxococcota bacterium]
MTSKTLPERVDAPAQGTPGFQAHINGATLADLVQMECLAGSRRVVRVASESHVGYLFFRGGAVVHAIARSAIGEAAALEILLWNEGSFEPVDREWPIKESITCSWQSLLLRAAQTRDERQGQRVVSLRADARVKPGRPPLGESMEFDATPIEVAGHVLRSEDFQLVLRLNADGAVALNQGASQDFADIVAYAGRLSDLIGGCLGAESFVALECAFRSGRCFIVREEGGDVVALRPRDGADSTAIAALLGL